LLAVLKSRWFLALIGLLFIVLILWFGGPYVGIADSKPLESVAGRLIAVMLVVLIFALIVVVRLLRAKQSNQALADGVAQQGAAESAAGRAPASGDEKQLRKRFERDPADPKHFLTVWGVGYRFLRDGAP